MLKIQVLIFSFIWAILGNKVNAQNSITELGARSRALGNANSALVGNWSIFHNPSGIASIHHYNVLFSVENQFGISGLNSAGAGIIIPSKWGSVGTGVFRFGDDLFHQQSISLSFANKFGISQLGIRINYQEIFIENFGNRALVSLDFGGMVDLGEKIRIGAYMRNINQAKLSEFQEERLPVLLNIGFSYYPNSKFLINADLEKDINFDPRFKLGFEYQFLPKFDFRTGVNTAPFVNYFGLGMKTWKVNIDYSISIDFTLGNSNQVSLSYSLAKK